MKVFQGEVEWEERDICKQKGCWKRDLCCEMQYWLKEHKATMKILIEYCQHQGEK